LTNPRPVFARVWKFYAVGAGGIAVQLATLSALVSVLGVNYAIATLFAVEAAVLHNFVWHQRFTWSDRRSSSVNIVMARIMRFHLSAGATSLAGNFLFMYLLAGQLGMHYLLANIISIAACSVLNFVLSDHLVFVAEGA